MRKNKLLKRIVALLVVIPFVLTDSFAVYTWENSTGEQKEAMLKIAESMGYTTTQAQWAEAAAQKAREAEAAQAEAGEGQGGWYENYMSDDKAYETGDTTTTTNTLVNNVSTEEMDNLLSDTSFDTGKLSGDVTQEDMDQLAAELGDGYVVVYNHMERDGSGDQTKLAAGGDIIETNSNNTEVAEAESKTVVKLKDGTFLAVYKLKEEPTVPEIPDGIPNGTPPPGVTPPDDIPTDHQHKFTTTIYTTKCTLNHLDEEYGLKADDSWSDTSFTSNIDPAQSKNRPLKVGSEFTLYGNIHVVRDVDQDVDEGTEKCKTPLYEVTTKSCSCGYSYEASREEIGVCGKPLSYKKYGDVEYTEKTHAVTIEFIGFRVEGQGKTVKLGEEKTITQKPTLVED